MPIVKQTHSTQTLLYDRHEVARVLGVTERTIWQYIKDHRIPAQLIGQKWYISERNLHAFLNGARYTAEGYKIGRGRKHRVRSGQYIEAPKYTGEYEIPEWALAELEKNERDVFF